MNENVRLRAFDGLPIKCALWCAHHPLKRPPLCRSAHRQVASTRKISSGIFKFSNHSFHCLNVHFYIEKFSWNQRPGNRPAHWLAECNTFSNLLTENERHNVKWWPLEAERVGRPLVFGESWRPVVCWALLQNWASFLANWAIKHVQPETVDQENSFLKKNQNFNGESMKIRYISCCSDTKMSSLFPGEMIYDWAFIFFWTFPFRFRGQRGSREIVGNFSRANLTGGSGHFHFLMGSHWSPVDNFGFFFQHSARFQSNSSILPRWTIAVDCSENSAVDLSAIRPISADTWPAFSQTENTQTTRWSIQTKRWKKNINNFNSKQKTKKCFKSRQLSLFVGNKTDASADRTPPISFKSVGVAHLQAISLQFHSFQKFSIIFFFFKILPKVHLHGNA